MHKFANFESVPKQSPSIKRSNLYSSTFGSSIPELQYAYSDGADTSKYRFGFNGMAKVLETAKDAYDFGARIYNGSLGRWWSIDPMASKYPDFSPYCGLVANPINMIDPDGKLVIFVNGWWGSSIVGTKSGGNLAHWSQTPTWVPNVQQKIGDKKAIFVDGSGSTMLLSLPGARFQAGYAIGKQMAREVYQNVLEKGETIKFITSSQGTAFQRGISQAFYEYVNDYNIQVEIHNNEAEKYNKSIAELKKQFPNMPFCQNLQPIDLKVKIDLNIEFTLDLDPFQGALVGKDPNANKNYFMLNNDISNGPDNTMFLGSAISGSIQLGLNPSTGISYMNCHYPGCAPVEYFPNSSNNGNEFYLKQYGNNNKNFVPPSW